MNCPSCKDNQKLGTKRTTAGHREVVREKHCDKCQTSFETVERFNSDIQSDQMEIKEEIKKLEIINKHLLIESEEHDVFFCKLAKFTEIASVRGLDKKG